MVRQGQQNEGGMIGRPVAAAHLVLGLLAARLGPLDSHTPHLGEPGCAEEGRPVMGVSAAMFKWGAGPRDHTRNVQGLVMLYNIKTTYTLHGACACNPETVLWSRAGWRRACEPVSVGSKAEPLPSSTPKQHQLFFCEREPLSSSTPKQHHLSACT